MNSIDESYLESINDYIQRNGSTLFRVNQIGTIFEKDQKKNLNTQDAYGRNYRITSKKMLVRRLFEYSNLSLAREIIEKNASIDFLVLSEASELFRSKIIGENPDAKDIKKRYEGQIKIVKYDDDELEKYLIKIVGEFSAMITYHAFDDLERTSRKAPEIELFNKRGSVKASETNEGFFYSKYDLQVSAEHLIPAAEYQDNFKGFEDRLGYIKRVDDLISLHFGIIISGTIKDPVLRNEAREILSNPYISIDSSLYHVIGRTVLDFYNGDAR